jgi:hypothetical protein
MVLDAWWGGFKSLLRFALGQEDAAGSSNPLPGVWHLVSYSAKDADSAATIHPYGERAHGYLMYSADGRMSALVTAQDRQWSGTAGTPEERAAAFSTCTAYMGAYRWQGDRVVHEIDVALNPTWVGMEQVRYARLEGNRLILTTPPSPTPPDGKVRVGTLVWERGR